jgi:hypothetical protein
MESQAVGHKLSTYPTRMEVTQYNCKENWEWLKSYGLSDDEIDLHFFYSPEQQRHVFWNLDLDGTEFFEARTASTNRIPKSLQHGQKPFVVLGNHEDHQDVVVVVEDIISAIKVSRHYLTIPLFGSHLSPADMAKIGKLGVRGCVIWLDADKYTVGMHYAKQLSAILPTTALQTKEDPKCLHDTDIIVEVENAVEAMESV